MSTATIIDTGSVGPHSGFRVLRVSNIEGGSGRYAITWRPICDLTAEERQLIDCNIDYRDPQLEDDDCAESSGCEILGTMTTCCRSGNCGGEGVTTRYRYGQTTKELIVSVEGIPRFADNSAAPCQMIFHWQVTDLVTGAVFNGCCSAVFTWRVITPPPINVCISTDVAGGCQDCGAPPVENPAAIVAPTIDTSSAHPVTSVVLEVASVTDPTRPAAGELPHTVLWEEVAADQCEEFGTFNHIVTDGQLEVIVDATDYKFTESTVPCRRTYRWTVQDMSVTDYLGNPIGRRETGTCVVEFNKEVISQPGLVIELDELTCGQVIDVDSMPQDGDPNATIDSDTVRLTVTGVSGGSGDYTVQWNTVPAGGIGSCYGDVVANPHPFDPNIMEVTLYGIPAYSDNTQPGQQQCARDFVVTVTDNVTGAVAYKHCEVRFNIRPIAIPELDVVVDGCGVNLVLDTSWCREGGEQGGRTPVVLTILPPTNGSGDYTYEWEAASRQWPYTFDDLELSPDGRRLSVEWRAPYGQLPDPTVRTFTYIVTDNITGQVVTGNCRMFLRADYVTECPSLGVEFSGPTDIFATSDVDPDTSATGMSSPAVQQHAVVVGGSGSNTFSWSANPIAGNMLQYPARSEQHASAWGKEHNVRATGIPLPTTSDTDLFYRYSYTATDTLTGQVINGTQTYNIHLRPADQIPCVGFGTSTHTVDLHFTNMEPITVPVTVNDLSWTSTHAVYEVTLVPNVQTDCGLDAVVLADPIVLTEFPTSHTFDVTITPPYPGEGQCQAIVSFDIYVTFDPPGSPGAVTAALDWCSGRFYPFAEIDITWDTCVPPVVNPTTPPPVHITSSAVHQVALIPNATKAGDITWSVSDNPCADLDVVLVEDSLGGGMIAQLSTTAEHNIDCAVTVTATVEWEGDCANDPLNEPIEVDFVIPVTVRTGELEFNITSVTNCGQSKQVAAQQQNRTVTFDGMTVNHTAGAGGPYTYYWEINTLQDDDAPLGTPGPNWTVSGSNKTFSPSATAPTSAPASSGYTARTYMVRVRDGAGNFTNWHECTCTLNWEIAPPVLDKLTFTLAAAEECSPSVPINGVVCTQSEFIYDDTRFAQIELNNCVDANATGVVTVSGNIRNVEGVNQYPFHFTASHPIDDWYEGQTWTHTIGANDGSGTLTLFIVVTNNERLPAFPGPCVPRLTSAYAQFVENASFITPVPPEDEYELGIVDPPEHSAI